MLKRLTFIAALFITVGAFAFSGITYQGPAVLTQFDAEYGLDAARVSNNLPAINPDNCPLGDGTYETDPTLAGSKLQQATLLAAFLANRQVALALSGCGPDGHPRIINVHLQ